VNVIYEHSHLNGKEHLIVHFPNELQEILDVISSVDGSVWKRSAERAKNERAQRAGQPHAEVYDQKNINQQFLDLFRERGWNRRFYSYFATPNEQVAREIMNLPPDQAKDIIQANQLIPYKRSNETDFMKNKIAIEIIRVKTLLKNRIIPMKIRGSAFCGSEWE